MHPWACGSGAGALKGCFGGAAGPFAVFGASGHTHDATKRRKLTEGLKRMCAQGPKLAKNELKRHIREHTTGSVCVLVRDSFCSRVPRVKCGITVRRAPS
eukprot:5250796-Prymnesium_polylepis.1